MKEFFWSIEEWYSYGGTRFGEDDVMFASRYENGYWKQILDSEASRGWEIVQNPECDADVMDVDESKPDESEQRKREWREAIERIQDPRDYERLLKEWNDHYYPPSPSTDGEGSG